MLLLLLSLLFGFPAYGEGSTAVEAVPVVAQENGPIAFSGTRQVSLLDEDGSATKLTNGPGRSYSPSFAPDGKRLVYVSQPGRYRTQELLIMNIETGRKEPLTDNGLMEDRPAWSPDGEWIAFERLVEGENPQTEIFKMRADGSEVTRLTTNDYHDWGASWSPDSSEILYTSFGGPRSTDNQIVKMSSDGSNAEVFIDDDRLDEDNAVWSPDGSTIAYEASRSLMLLDLETRRSELLFEGGAPAWSPDGEWLLCTRYEDIHVQPLVKIRMSDRREVVLFRGQVPSSTAWGPRP